MRGTGAEQVVRQAAAARQRQPGRKGIVLRRPAVHT